MKPQQKLTSDENCDRTSPELCPEMGNLLDDIKTEEKLSSDESLDRTELWREARSVMDNMKTDEKLTSDESLDRASPELWRETRNVLDNMKTEESLDNALPTLSSHRLITTPSSTIPGIPNYADIYSAVKAEQPWKFNSDNKEDMEEAQKLSKMTRTELLAEVKRLHDLAYTLGLEESKEVTRSKFLSVFTNDKKD